jgi:hypothetical protein
MIGGLHAAIVFEGVEEKQPNDLCLIQQLALAI